jgi:hypothetical protein
LDALAERISVPAQTLKATIADSASFGANGNANTTPYYSLGPAKSWIVFSERGLRANENLQVLNRAGKPIPGLYAVGSVGQGGLLLEGHGRHLAWAFTSARLAGRHSALLSTDWVQQNT